MKPTVITPHYPAPRFPERGAFVERLVSQWQNTGYACTVIAPDAIPILLRSFRKPRKAHVTAGETIVRPRYMSYGNTSGALVNRFRMTRRAFVHAAERGANAVPDSDFYYGKFLFRGGESAVALGSRYRKPSFADVGESWSFDALDEHTREDAKQIAGRLDGIFCVSERLREEMIGLGADPGRVFLAHNDVDTGRFTYIPRLTAREELGLSPDHFVVLFAGHFVRRKGPLRVLQAIEKSHHTVRGVFLGRGTQTPTGPRVLYSGSVPNEQMPLWLNAADIFVLPSLGEGHCNVINEATACGLPVITSDIADIRSQVDPTYSILIHPEDTDAIAGAIEALRQDPKRREGMSHAARSAVHDAAAETRAAKIMSFIHSIVEGE